MHRLIARRNEERKIRALFFFLSGFFVTNVILAELLGSKIFSLEKTLDLPPFGLSMRGHAFSFDLTAGVIIWPFVFITTDIINEYFGKAGVKRVSYFSVLLIVYMFVVMYTAIGLAPADFWLHAYRDHAHPAFDINRAFSFIFSAGLGIIVGSIIAFLVGQLLDVFIFQQIKKRYGERMIWLRATGSTLVSQLIDSFVVLYIAFYMLSDPSMRWPLEKIMGVGLINYTYKFAVAIVLTPMLYLAHYLIDKYLGASLSTKMKQASTTGGRDFL